ncbi:MAG: amidase family protein [Lautropia sp.]|nr:amidase family protein [Lautropia sp.]
MAEWVGASSEQLVAAYGSERASPVEVAEAMFERIDRLDGVIGAMRSLCHGSALDSAMASAHRWQRRVPLSPLDGVPVTVREDLAVPADIKHLEGASPVVARLLEAGCVVLGTTVMAGHDTLVSGLGRDGRLVRNPWQPMLTAGGSSSGAAAACAAGYAPLNIGIDRVGAIRLPAAFCGVFGFKPTQGRVPVSEPALGRVAGPVTRTVHDAAAAMNILVRPDDRDFMSLPPEQGEYRMRVDGMSPKSLSIAVLTDMGHGLSIDPAILGAVQAAARALQMAGAAVETVDSFLSPAMFDGLQLYLESAVHAELQAMPADEQRRVPAFVHAWSARRAGQASGLAVMQAWRQVMAMRAAISAALEGYDYLLMPVSPVLPYAAEALSPSGNPADGLPHIICTAPWNLAENPAATVNWTQDASGAPVGVQVVGHRFDDLGVLRLSRSLEILRPDQDDWPD